MSNLTQERKNLMHKVMDGNLSLVHYMHQLDRFLHCDNILKWLIQNRIIGKTLQEWIEINFNRSTLSMVQFIIKYREKNSEYKPIIKNKDWFC